MNENITKSLKKTHFFLRRGWFFADYQGSGGTLASGEALAPGFAPNTGVGLGGI